jgi:hypothetical protein
MIVRRSLGHLPAFVVAGSGAFLLVTWLYERLGWLEPLTPSLVVLMLASGAGIGLLSWLGFEIGRLRWRRARRFSGATPRGVSLRGYAFSLLGLLVLGTLYGLILTVPAATGQTVALGNGVGLTLLTLLGYALVFGAVAVIPAANGLLSGDQATPSAGRALLGGLALGVGGSVAFVLPAILLVALIPPSCAVTKPPSCGPWYFGPSFFVGVLRTLAIWGGPLVGFASGVAASLGVLVARLTDRRLAQE